MIRSSQWRLHLSHVTHDTITRGESGGGADGDGGGGGGGVAGGVNGDGKSGGGAIGGSRKPLSAPEPSSVPEATSSSWRNSAIASTAPTTAPKSIALRSVKMNFEEIRRLRRELPKRIQDRRSLPPLERASATERHRRLTSR